MNSASLLRPAGLIALAALALGSTVLAQPSRRYRPPPTYVQFGPPDQQEGRQIIEEFRRLGIAGDYYLEFELRVLPRRGAGTVLPGRMWGKRVDGGPVSRVSVGLAGAADEERLLVQSGVDGAVWRWRGAGAAVKLDAAALFEPVAGTGLTAFDLQLPFIYWTDFTYEGLARMRGRPAHQFIFYPPGGIAERRPEPTGVRAYLDTQYGGLVKVELIGPEGRVLKTLNLLDFKKVGDQWLVKSIDLRDETTRDKTRFAVVAAALNQSLDGGIFDPASLAGAVAAPAGTALIKLQGP